MVSRYERFVDCICNAGFFATSVEHMGNWDRVTVCSKRLPGPRYTGNSFWVSGLESEWYVGTWGGAIYRVKTEQSLIEFAIEWLTLEPDVTTWDFGATVREKYMLEPVSDSDFRSATRKQGEVREGEAES
jgi:hypothetical protein